MKKKKNPVLRFHRLGEKKCTIIPRTVMLNAHNQNEQQTYKVNNLLYDVWVLSLLASITLLLGHLPMLYMLKR